MGWLGMEAASWADQCLQGNEPEQGQPELAGNENPPSKLWLLQISSPPKNSSPIIGSAHKQKPWCFVSVGRSPQSPAAL